MSWPPHGKVIVLEAESAPGYHSTGRSAALYTRNFGSPTVRAFNRASLPFLSAPAAGLRRPSAAESARRAHHRQVGPARARSRRMLALGAADGSIVEMSQAEALQRAPHLKPEAVAFAAYEDGVMDMDVAAIHQGFLRGLKARGGTVPVRCRRQPPRSPRTARWHARTPAGDFVAPVVVNAAGAWADKVAALAGAQAGRPGAEAPHGHHRRSAERHGYARLAGRRRGRLWLLLQAGDRPRHGLAGRRDAGRALRRAAGRSRCRHHRRLAGTQHARFPSVASRTDGPACAASSPTTGRSQASTTRCRRLLLAVRPGRLRHHDVVVARPHRRRPDHARRSCLPTSPRARRDDSRIGPERTRRA